MQRIILSLTASFDESDLRRPPWHGVIPFELVLIVIMKSLRADLIKVSSELKFAKSCGPNMPETEKTRFYECSSSSKQVHTQWIGRPDIYIE